MGDANGWIGDLWVYYLAYTKRPIHTAATAALAIFGLLIFIDPLFVLVAIACYVLPPIVLYVLDDDPDIRLERTTGLSEHDAPDPGRRGGAEAEPEPPDPVVGDGDSDSDGIDTDSDSDGDDSDSDSDGVDTDSDSDGVDTDTDSDSDS